MAETTVFGIQKCDGKYIVVEAKRIAKCGSWWHLRKKDGGVVKLNGGEGWHETIYEAWAQAMRRMVWRCSRDYHDDDPHKWRRSQNEAIKMFGDAMEDCYENGKLLGQIEAAIKRKDYGVRDETT